MNNAAESTSATQRLRIGPDYGVVGAPILHDRSAALIPDPSGPFRNEPAPQPPAMPPPPPIKAIGGISP